MLRRIERSLDKSENSTNRRIIPREQRLVKIWNNYMKHDVKETLFNPLIERVFLVYLLDKFGQALFCKNYCVIGIQCHVPR